MNDRERKLEDVRRVKLWWHTIDLGDGIVTPGQPNAHQQELRVAAMPMPWEGKTVLDVGCWDGFYSFWCEKQGARVTPVDNFQYRDFAQSKYGVELKGGEGFGVAARWLRSGLTILNRDFTDFTDPPSLLQRVGHGLKVWLLHRQPVAVLQSSTGHLERLDCVPAHTLPTPAGVVSGDDCDDLSAIRQSHGDLCEHA